MVVPALESTSRLGNAQTAHRVFAGCDLLLQQHPVEERLGREGEADAKHENSRHAEGDDVAGEERRVEACGGDADLPVLDLCDRQPRRNAAAHAHDRTCTHTRCCLGAICTGRHLPRQATKPHDSSAVVGRL